MAASGRGASRIVGSLLIAVLPVRVLLDVLHGLTLPGTELSLGRALSAVLGVIVLGLGAAAVARDRQHPLRVPASIFAILLGIGALRSVVDPMETARLLLLYASPLAYAWAVSVWLTDEGDQRRLLAGVAVAAIVPVSLSLAALLAGQPDELVLHDYPRLHGAYSSHHNHAVAMTLFACLGGLFAARGGARAGRLAGVVLAAVATLLMGLTWVRTTLLMLVIVALTALVVRRRWGLLGGLAVVAVVAIGLSPTLRDRFSDVGAVLALRPPEEGWGAVGSWRVRIWVESWQAFVAQGPAAWLGGLGLGAHRTLHRHLDPHQEYLALWYQLGVLGPVTYVWMLAVALRDTLRAAVGAPGWTRDVATLAAGLVVAVLATSAISNDFLPRALLATAVWGLCGLVWAATPRAGSALARSARRETGSEPAGPPPGASR